MLRQARAGASTRSTLAADQRTGAEATLATLQARERSGYLLATSLAAIPTALGDHVQAPDALERACAQRDTPPQLSRDGRALEPAAWTSALSWPVAAAGAVGGAGFGQILTRSGSGPDAPDVSARR